MGGTVIYSGGEVCVRKLDGDSMRPLEALAPSEIEEVRTETSDTEEQSEAAQIGFKEGHTVGRISVRQSSHASHVPVAVTIVLQSLFPPPPPLPAVASAATASPPPPLDSGSIARGDLQPVTPLKSHKLSLLSLILLRSNVPDNAITVSSLHYMRWACWDPPISKFYFLFSD